MTATSTDLGVFQLSAKRGAYIASFGPKGTGKSELITRFFIRYPYHGLLLDYTQDIDPGHEFTRPLTPELHAMARRLYEMKSTSLDALYDFRVQLRSAWSPEGGFVKYRYTPNFLADDWLKVEDAYVGLAYLMGHCFLFFDEIGEQAPVSRTPRWTRQDLRVGRHESLSNGMAGPRPADLDPNVLNQADLVTIHGQLHEIDVDRMAKQLHLKTRELQELVEQLGRPEIRDGVEVYPFIAYEKKTKEIHICPPLPPRRKNERIQAT